MKKLVKKYLHSSPYLYKFFVRYHNISSLFYRGKHTYQIKDIVVCGVQRSGSTLLFNIINEILIESNRETDTFFEKEIFYKRLLENEMSPQVRKNHTYLPLVAKRIKKGITIGFFTHRDIRDILVSSIQKGWIENIQEWVDSLRIKYMINNSLLYAKTPKMNIYSYHDLMHNRPQVIVSVAKVLGVELNEESIEKITQKTSIAKVKEELQKIPEDVKLHYDNQLHKNHIADGNSGKWENFFSEKEKIFLNSYCKKYLQYFKYPT